MDSYEVAQQVMAELREDRLRMKLDPLHGQAPVANPHDFAIVGPGCNFELLRQGFALDDERVVACSFERLRDTAENALARVVNGRYFAMHQLPGVHDPAAEGLPDALVAETYAEDRDLTRKALDQRHRDAGFVGRARSGRNHDVRRPQRSHFFERYFVVAKHDDLLFQLTEVLHQVVRERIVVVDHEQHVRPPAAQSR